MKFGDDRTRDAVARLVLERRYPQLRVVGTHHGFVTKDRAAADVLREVAEAKPDILCVGKALTGGYLTLAATLCTDAVAEAVCAAGPGALMHGPTFMANPLATAVALASVDLLVEGPWQQRVASIEGWLAGGLAAARDLPGVADVRVLGAIGVIEANEPFGAADQEWLVQRGVWLRPFGRLLYTMPPFVTERADLDQIVMAMVDLVANR